MQIFLAAGIIVECVILLILGFTRKLTRKTFSVLMAATAVYIMALVGVYCSQGRENHRNDQRENLYISARLLEGNYTKEALDAQTEVVDAQCMEYQVQSLRGLILNQNGYYNTAISYLKDAADDAAVKIYEASVRNVPVEEALKEEVIDRTLELLQASEAEAEIWEAKMKLLYIDMDGGTEAGQLDAVCNAKEAIRNNDFQNAYQIMKDAAQTGGIQEDVIVSDMYVKNYNMRTMEESDAEYDRLWEKATQMQAQVNLSDIQRKKEEETDKTQEIGETLISDTEKEYQRVYAEYLLAQRDITSESVGRAINYLECARPDDYETNIGYQLQLCRLYYLNQEEDKAYECLDRIFAVEEIDQNQWLGTDAYLVKENYMTYLSDAAHGEYYQIFESMMQHLYQGLFAGEDYQDFSNFVAEYLRQLMGGIVINDIDAKNYPEMTVNVSVTNEALEIGKESLRLFDTGAAIEEFQVAESEVNDLALCFVLDRSGSMSGSSIEDAKKAIRQSLASLEDFVKIGLVAFDNDASIECMLTSSQYLLQGKLEGIKAGGGTNIVAGLEQAYDVLQEAGGKKVIILLSDGYDGSEENALVDILGRLRAEEIVTCAIGLEGCDEEYLKHIADETGGKYIPVNDTGELGSSYHEIQKSLVYVYTITYTNQVALQSADAAQDTAAGQGSENGQKAGTVRIRYKDSFAQTQKSYMTQEEERETESSLFLEEQSADYYKQTGGSERSGR